MTTEVQIGRNHSHLDLLRKVISRTASWTGMGRKDSQDLEDAVSRACVAAMGDASADITTPITVSVCAEQACMTVDITNPSVGYMPLCVAQYADDGAGTMAQIGSLVDSIEFVTGETSATIRITKHSPAVGTRAASPAYLSNNLQI